VSATGIFIGDGSGLSGVIAGVGSYLPLSGDTMSGDINMGEYNISNIDELQFNLTSSLTHIHQEGSLY